MYWKNDVKFTSPLSSICQTALAEASNPYCVLDIYILQLGFSSLGVMKDCKKESRLQISRQYESRRYKPV